MNINTMELFTSTYYVLCIVLFGWGKTSYSPNIRELHIIITCCGVVASWGLGAHQQCLSSMSITIMKPESAPNTPLTDFGSCSPFNQTDTELCSAPYVLHSLLICRNSSKSGTVLSGPLWQRCINYCGTLDFCRATAAAPERQYIIHCFLPLSSAFTTKIGVTRSTNNSYSGKKNIESFENILVQ